MATAKARKGVTFVRPKNWGGLWGWPSPTPLKWSFARN